MNETESARTLPSAVAGNPKFQEVQEALTGELPSAQKPEVSVDLYRYVRDVLERGQHLGKGAEVVADLNRRIAEIDALIAAQVNEIIHDPEFQALEASWRGLESLVVNSGLQAGRLEIKVFNISKEELVEHLNEY